MTLFDRALSKAYAMRSAPLPEPPVAPVPVARGWVARLRTPASKAAVLVENAKGAGPAPAIPEAIAAAVVPVVDSASAGVAAPAIDPRDDVVYPPDLVVRVDASHAEPVATADSGAWSWPEISHKLLQSTAGGGLISLADSLESMSVQRRIRSLAVTGQGRQTGRTTLLLTLARLLVERTSLRVLLVDFDFGNPCLAAALGVSPEIDIAHFVYEGAGADGPLIELIPHRFGFLPLGHPMAESELTRERLAVVCDLLRATEVNYDLTLIDAGPCDSIIDSMLSQAPVFDACLAVSRHAGAAVDPSHLNAFSQRGIEYLGTVETFVPEVPRNEPHFIR